jgi:hypothetical protein
MNTIAIQQADLREPSGNKSARWSRWFILSAGGIFLITGLAKIFSAFGSAKYLDLVDPVFGISFGHLMLSVGIIELIVSGICFFLRRWRLSLGLVTWMATSFAAYRMGLSYTGWHRPCSCMGNLTDALHIPPKVADGSMKFILAYLMIGSYCALFQILKQRRKMASLQ